MPFPAKILQPRHYDAFRCIGPECEDICCEGWSVTIDRETYDKYQKCDDSELGPSLHDLITINTADMTEDEYATIKLAGAQCPFLSEGLCSIQKELGESYLSNTCAIYPRMMNRVGDVLERTLDLSCPEAARILLLDQGPLAFETVEWTNSFRMGNPSVPDTPHLSYDGRPYEHFGEIRRLTVFGLHERSYPLWKRLVIIGYLSDKLNEMASSGNEDGLPALVAGYAHAITQHMFDELLSKCILRPEAQLITILELVVSRITSDFTSRRFLGCYEEFMQALEWTQESSLSQIAERYTEAYITYYAPFMAKHDKLMERYFTNYIYKNLFPLGRMEANRRAGLHHVSNSICVQYMLMVVHYAIIRTLLIGMAGFHKSAFGVDHAVKLIQCASKEFQHSTSFPARAIEILTRNGLKDCRSMAVLVQDPAV